MVDICSLVQKTVSRFGAGRFRFLEGRSRLVVVGRSRFVAGRSQGGHFRKKNIKVARHFKAQMMLIKLLTNITTYEWQEDISNFAQCILQFPQNFNICSNKNCKM